MKSLLNIALLAAAVLLIFQSVSVGMSRESKRQQAAFNHLCAQQGEAMNKYYGREVCPPTPQG